MNAIRAFFIFLLALAPAAPALAQRDDPDWVVYNPPKPISKYTWLDLDAKYPYGQPRLILSSDVALRLPTLFQRDFPPLPSNTRLPLHTAPDIPDLSKASWRVWRFGGFVADGLKVPTMESDRMYETNEVRTVTYRPLPARPNVPAIPHRAEGLTYGNLRIPVLNYSPDMVTGYPCPLSDERQDSPRVWLEVGGGRATGAAIIPDDPCITQRALDFAVYALSRASPDRSMRDFLAGLEEIRNRASPESYRLSDPAYVYRLFYLRKKEGPGWIAWYGRYTPAHGGLMHFLPTSEDKRLYWVLLHPHGDARLHPVSYPFDAEIVRVKAENNPPSPYWRQRYTRDEGTYNQWVFDDIAVGSADWSFTAGIDRITYAIASQQEVQAPLPSSALLNRLLPSFVTLGR